MSRAWGHLQSLRSPTHSHGMTPPSTRNWARSVQGCWPPSSAQLRGSGCPSSPERLVPRMRSEGPASLQWASGEEGSLTFRWRTGEGESHSHPTYPGASRSPACPISLRLEVSTEHLTPSLLRETEGSAGRGGRVLTMLGGSPYGPAPHPPGSSGSTPAEPGPGLSTLWGGGGRSAAGATC